MPGNSPTSKDPFTVAVMIGELTVGHEKFPGSLLDASMTYSVELLSKFSIQASARPLVSLHSSFSLS